MTTKLILGLLFLTTILAGIVRQPYSNQDEPSDLEDRLTDFRGYPTHNDRKELPIKPLPPKRWFETAAESRMQEGYDLPYDVPMPVKRQFHRSQSERDQLHSESLMFLILVIVVPVLIITIIIFAVKVDQFLERYYRKKRQEKNYFEASSEENSDFGSSSEEIEEIYDFEASSEEDSAYGEEDELLQHYY